MGLAKALLPWRGTTVVETLISTLRRGGVERVVVVTAPGDSELQDLLAARADANVTVNPEPSDGMLSSILAGLRTELGRPDSSASALLICPVDHPLVSSDTVALLLSRHRSSARHLLVPSYQGRRGHPVLIPWPLAGELEGLDLDRGLRQLFEDREPAVIEVPVSDPGVIANLNTPEDYAAALASLAP